MALSPKEELELLQLEEEEYQHSLKGGVPAKQPQGFTFPGVISGAGEALQGGAEGFIEATPAMAAGAAQGATMGFSDELGATGDVAIDLGKQALSGQVPDLLGNKWREYQKSREAANKAIAEESPIAYMGGELAGGIATSALAPSIGVVKGLGAAGKLSPKVLAFLEGKAAGAGGRIAGKGTAMAIEGAPLGAAYGAGSSEADINTMPELAMDTASGAAMGSIGGLAIGGGAAIGKEALDYAPKLANQYDFLRKMGKQFGMGEKGLDPSSTEGSRLQQTLANKNLPNKTVNEIMEADKYNGIMVGDSLDPLKNPNAAKPINIDAEAVNSMTIINKMRKEHPSILESVDPKTQKLLFKIEQFKGGDMSPLEARDLKDGLYELSHKLDGLTSDSAHFTAQEANALAGKINTKLKDTVPEYKVAAEKFEQFRSFIPETILQPGVPLDKRSVYLGNLKNQETKLLEKTKELLGGATMPGASAKDMSSVGLKELQQRLRTLQRTNPKAVEKMGGTGEEVFGKLQNRSDTMGSVYQGQGIEPNQGLGRTVTGTVVGSGQGFGFNMANRAGQLKTVLNEGSLSPVRAAKVVFNYGDDKLMGLANNLKASPASKPLGDALEKALLNKDTVAKNAALFKLLQIPEYRAMLKGDEDTK